MKNVNEKAKQLINLYLSNTVDNFIYRMPITIFNFLKKELTTTLTIKENDKVFNDTLDWIGKKYKNHDFRQMIFCNDWDDGQTRKIMSLGYGSHILKYKNTLLFISYYRKDRTDLLSITCLGRSRKILDRLVKDINNSNKDTSKTEIYKMLSNEWAFVKRQPKRRMNSVFIEQDKKKLVLDALKRFREKEQWYLNNGIPYQLGILLYGAPGCGKTSFIKAIAAHLNYPIYYLPVDYLFNIEKSINSLPDKSLLVIEDIDCNTTAHSRVNNNPNDNTDIKLTNNKDTIQEVKTTNLAAILNSIDGIMSAHGRILIVTTNHIEKLDKALIRPGRIDLKIEIGSVNEEILRQFMNNYFPNDNINYDSFQIKHNLTISNIQEYILQDKSSKEIINLIKKQETINGKTL